MILQIKSCCGMLVLCVVMCCWYPELLFNENTVDTIITTDENNEEDTPLVEQKRKADQMMETETSKETTSYHYNRNIATEILDADSSAIHYRSYIWDYIMKQKRIKNGTTGIAHRGERSDRLSEFE